MLRELLSGEFLYRSYRYASSSKTERENERNYVRAVSRTPHSIKLIKIHRVYTIRYGQVHWCCLIGRPMQSDMDKYIGVV
jgi:hypothetical protein